MDLVKLREERINDLRKANEIILTDLDLQLLMYDGENRENNGNYNDIIWFNIFRNISRKNKDVHNIEANINLNESELLLMSLVEKTEELKLLYDKYNKILNNSKDTIGIKLDKNEINYLINIITNNRLTEEENEEFYNTIKEKYKLKNNSDDNVIYHKF